MKDHLFTGRDVEEALAEAGRALGLPPQALRYVVLERGSAGPGGAGGAPARIAVFFEAVPAPGPPPPLPPADPRAAARSIVEGLARAAGVDLWGALEETEAGPTLRLEGEGRAFLLEDGAEPLRALEHLLQRAWARGGGGGRLRVACAGAGEQREEALAETARALAAAVRADGVERSTKPLNSYERRIVHLALGAEEGVRTYSVGEGPLRRVTVAPAGDPPRRGA